MCVTTVECLPSLPVLPCMSRKKVTSVLQRQTQLSDVKGLALLPPKYSKIVRNWMLFQFSLSWQAILTPTHLKATWYEAVTRELLRPEALTNGQRRQPSSEQPTSTTALKMGSPSLQNNMWVISQIQSRFSVSMETLYDSARPPAVSASTCLYCICTCNLSGKWRLYKCHNVENLQSKRVITKFRHRFLPLTIHSHSYIHKVHLDFQSRKWSRLLSALRSFKSLQY